MMHLLNLSSDDMEALVEHREKLDAELEQLRENRMELEAEIEGKENALNIIDKIIEETYKTEKTLAEQMNERLAEMKMTKAEAALKMNYSRAALSQYLNGKYASDPTELEKKVREFLAATGGVAEGQEPENSVPTGAGKLKKKVEFFESRDFVQTIGVCQACQEYMGLGIIVGKSGQGKTHALKKYAELPRVAYIECDDTMACRDLVEAIEKLGVFLVIAGSVMGVIGSLGKLFLSAKNAIGLVKTATLGMNTAFLASPITWVIAGIVALVAAFVVLWNKSEAFRGFWIGLFEQVKSSFMQAWQTLKPALQNLGQKFMELYQAVQPILEVLGAVLGAVLTVALGHFVGCIQGIISALTPLTNALSSLVSFVTNVVNMIVSLFKGDFSGALGFASAAVGDLKDFFFNCFDAILSFLGGFASGFLDVVGGALSAIGIDATETITKMKDTIKNGLEAV